jgi:DNA-binding NtrC family response regulator
MPRSLLIIEDEETLRKSLARLFSKDGFEVDTAGSAEAGMKLVDQNVYDVIVSDIILPKMDGIEMISRLRETLPEQIFIVITAYASLDTAIRALKAGAYDYIMKPIIHEEIKQVVKNAIAQKDLQRENLLLKRQVEEEKEFESIIGESRSIKGILDEVRKIADTKSNVLILGETGTGKELLARVIHDNSTRKNMPFVPIHCSAIPESLLESELFGHAKGAFTGAVASKKGLLEEADGSTVFLDEIGDVPLSFQVKLLRAIEEQDIRPLGSTKSKKVDLRFISATNLNLKEAVEQGRFREDLYYRINVITINLPPIRERREDVPLLLEHYLRKYSAEVGKGKKEFSPEAYSILTSYTWPGNIRELQNVVERAVLISEGPAIGPEHLPEDLRGTESSIEGSLKKELSIEEYTRSFIMKYQGVYGEQELADKLGITRKTLWQKRKKYGIKRPS